MVEPFNSKAMKKTILFLAAALVTGLISCRKEVATSPAEETKDNNAPKVTITANTDNTRVNVDGLAVTWATGDAITVYDNTGPVTTPVTLTKNDPFTLVSGQNTKSATFEGTFKDNTTSSRTIYAFYPNGGFVVSVYNARFILPTAQQANSVGKYLYCVADPVSITGLPAETSIAMNFHPVAAVWDFNITNAPATDFIKKVVITKLGTALLKTQISVNLSLDASSNNYLVDNGQWVAAVNGQSVSVDVANAVGGATASAVLFPADYTADTNGFQYQVYTEAIDGSASRVYTFTSTAAPKIERAKRYHTALDCSLVTPSIVTTPPLSQPNSYIVAPGASVSIPVSKPYAFWTNTTYAATTVDLSTLTGTFTTKLLWQDTQNLITSVGSLNGSGSAATFSVQTGAGLSGNAVVAFVDPNGVVRWSWHLWVTDYAPDDIRTTQATSPTTALNSKFPVTGGYVHRYADGVGVLWGTGGMYANKVIMDRNIGAPSSSTSALYYQFGRKDPFCKIDQTLYDISNASVSLLNGGTTTVPLSTAVSNPTSYYPTTGIWTSTTGLGTNYSWHDVNASNATNAKSIFDPCPKGWKAPIGIPTSTPPYTFYTYSAMTTTTNQALLDGSGITYVAGSLVAGDVVFPNTGYYQGNGAVFNLPETPVLSSATAATATAQYATNLSTAALLSATRSSLVAMRCVQE